MLAKLKAAYSALSRLGIGGLWAGWISLTPDLLPVILAVERMPGLFLSLATCLRGHGSGIGSGAGRLAAELIAGGAPSVDPHRFRYVRLVGGSDLATPGMT